MDYSSKFKNLLKNVSVNNQTSSKSKMEKKEEEKQETLFDSNQTKGLKKDELQSDDLYGGMISLSNGASNTPETNNLFGKKVLNDEAVQKETEKKTIEIKQQANTVKSSSIVDKLLSGLSLNNITSKKSDKAVNLTANAEPDEPNAVSEKTDSSVASQIKIGKTITPTAEPTVETMPTTPVPTKMTIPVEPTIETMPTTPVPTADPQPTVVPQPTAPTITYGENGEYTVTTYPAKGIMGGSSTSTTYNKDGVKLRESSTSIGTDKPYTWTTEFDSDGKAISETFSNDKDGKDVVYVDVMKYDDNGNFIGKTRTNADGTVIEFDKDGKEIIPEPTAPTKPVPTAEPTVETTPTTPVPTKMTIPVEPTIETMPTIPVPTAPTIEPPVIPDTHFEGTEEIIENSDGSKTYNIIMKPGSVYMREGMVINSANGEDANFSIIVNADGSIVLNGDNLSVQAQEIKIYRKPLDPVVYDEDGKVYIDENKNKNAGIIDGDGNDVMMKPYAIFTPFNNLTINGNNNYILGSSADDKLTVEGNNNTVDLAAGEDSLVIRGENNTVRNVEDLTTKTWLVPAGEKGSLEYAAELLGMEARDLNDIKDIKYDDEGRVVAFNYGTWSGGATQEYTINYVEWNDSITIRSELDIPDFGKEVVEKDFDSNKELRTLSEYHYSPNGNETSAHYMNNYGSWEYYNNSEYNENGQIISNHSIYMSNGQVTGYMNQNMKYDSEGREISNEIKYLDANNNFDRSYLYETSYYADGNIKSSYYNNQYSDGSISKGISNYYENGMLKDTLDTQYDADGVRISDVTRKYDKDGALISTEGKRVVKANETSYIWANGKDISLTNKNGENNEVTYTIDANGHMELNANDMEINQESPMICYDYVLNTTNEADIADVADKNNAVDLEYTVIPPKYWGKPMTDMTINGNNNTIRGTELDDNISVYGNNNLVDLGAGEDVLNIVGNNNRIKNVEDVSMNAKPQEPEGPVVIKDYGTIKLGAKETVQFAVQTDKGLQNFEIKSAADEQIVEVSFADGVISIVGGDMQITDLDGHDDNLFIQGRTVVFNAQEGEDTVMIQADNIMLTAGDQDDMNQVDYFMLNATNLVSVQTGSSDEVIDVTAKDAMIDTGDGNKTIFANIKNDLVVETGAEGDDNIVADVGGTASIATRGGDDYVDLNVGGDAYVNTAASSDSLVPDNDIVRIKSTGGWTDVNLGIGNDVAEVISDNTRITKDNGSLDAQVLGQNIGITSNAELNNIGFYSDNSAVFDLTNAKGDNKIRTLDYSAQEGEISSEMSDAFEKATMVQENRCSTGEVLEDGTTKITEWVERTYKVGANNVTINMPESAKMDVKVTGDGKIDIGHMNDGDSVVTNGSYIITNVEEENVEYNRPAGAIGTVEYATNLILQNGFPNMALNEFVPTYDDMGRVIELNFKPNIPEPKYIYGDNGNFIATVQANVFAPPITKYEIAYNDDGTTVISAYNNISKQDIVRTFDKNGVEINGTVHDSETINKINDIDKLNPNWNINPENYSVEYDNQGRIVYLRFQQTHISYDENGNQMIGVSVGGENSYRISYNDDAMETTVSPYPEGMCGAAAHSYTYNSDGKLIRETISNLHTLGPSGWKEETVYNQDGSKVVTKTVNPAYNNGLKKVVTTYDIDGNVVDVKEVYDTVVAPMPAIPEPGISIWEAYPTMRTAATLLYDKINNDPSKILNPTFDEQGRLSTFSLDDGMVYLGSAPTYIVTYDEHNIMTITQRYFNETTGQYEETVIAKDSLVSINDPITISNTVYYQDYNVENTEVPQYDENGNRINNNSYVNHQYDENGNIIS